MEVSLDFAIVHEKEPYTAAAGIALITPSSADLISFLDDYKVPPIAFPYHLNGRRHARYSCSDNEHIGSVRGPAIFGCWKWTWVRHGTWMEAV